MAAGPPRAKLAWAIVAERPRGDPADEALRALRVEVEGAVVVAAREGRALVLELSRGDDALWLTVDPRRGPVVESATPGEHPGGLLVEGAALDRARARGPGFVDAHERALGDEARRAARSLLDKARARLTRRVAAIDADREAVREAERQAARARLFVSAAATARRGQRELEAVDYSSGAPVRVTLSLVPERGAREQLEALFARAKRLRAGERVAVARQLEASRAIEAIDAAREELAHARTRAEVDGVLSAVEPQLPRGSTPGVAPATTASRAVPSKLPRGVRAFTSATGQTIFVGKDAPSNDALTTRVARPGDLWLHARGLPGAHVVAPRWYARGGGDGETLLDAATLAAHFSGARGEAIVDVAYTDRRYVRRVRGAAAGVVALQEERVIPLRVEPARLARLLS